MESRIESLDFMELKGTGSILLDYTNIQAIIWNSKALHIEYMSHFRRNKDPKEILVIGEVAKAQEIEFL